MGASLLPPAKSTYYTYGCRICPLEFFIAAAKKNNDAAKFIVSLKQNNSEAFICAP